MIKIIEFKNKKGEILRGLLSEAKSSVGVVFVHGFERTTVESKFKSLSDRLNGQLNTFRFDFAGCGLSDGTFFDFDLKKAVDDLRSAIKNFVKETGVNTIHLIGHSVGACIILKFLKEQDNSNIDKVVLIAPSLNQKELMRYRFVKGANKDKEITWSNYGDYLNEKDFIKDVNVKQKMLKHHLISKSYFLENYKIDYNNYLEELEQHVYAIHGNRDDKVPMESNILKPRIIVRGGDHDLERPDMISQWLDKTTNFLLR